MADEPTSGQPGSSTNMHCIGLLMYVRACILYIGPYAYVRTHMYYAYLSVCMYSICMYDVALYAYRNTHTYLHLSTPLSL